MARNSGVMASASGGGVLAAVAYAPASQTDKTCTGTLAPLDTTNLTISFKAPASGKIVVTLSGFAIATSQAMNWALFDHTGGTIVGNTMCVTSSIGAQVYTTACFYITGLTGGTTYQYDWAGYSSSGGGVLRCEGRTTASGSDQGSPAVMVVFSA